MANQNFDPESQSSLNAQKEIWRKRLKLVRRSLNIARKEEASYQACQQLKKICSSAAFVLSFASFGSEIDLWPFNKELANENRLVLPRLVNGHLRLFLVKDIEQLEKHKWSFLEPITSLCTPLTFSQMDIALIPGLGFDCETKYRLGFGQGYYDKLLASSNTVQTYGIGFLEQAVDNLPYDKNDIPLNAILLF